MISICNQQAYWFGKQYKFSKWINFHKKCLGISSNVNSPMKIVKDFNFAKYLRFLVKIMSFFYNFGSFLGLPRFDTLYI